MIIKSWGKYRSTFFLSITSKKATNFFFHPPTPRLLTLCSHGRVDFDLELAGVISFFLVDHPRTILGLWNRSRFVKYCWNERVLFSYHYWAIFRDCLERLSGLHNRNHGGIPLRCSFVLTTRKIIVYFFSEDNWKWFNYDLKIQAVVLFECVYSNACGQFSWCLLEN